MKKKMIMILSLVLLTSAISAGVIILNDEIGRHTNNNVKVFDNRDEAIDFQNSNLINRILETNSSLTTFTYLTDKLCEVSIKQGFATETKCEICYEYAINKGNLTQRCTNTPFNNTEAFDLTLIVIDISQDLNLGNNTDSVWYKERTLIGGKK